VAAIIHDCSLLKRRVGESYRILCEFEFEGPFRRLSADNSWPDIFKPGSGRGCLR
jgi:hypothetical protein